MLVVSTAPARGADDPRTQQGEVHRQQTDVAGQIDVLKGDVAEVSAGLAAVTANVAASEASLSAAQRQVDAATALVASARAAEAQAAASVAQRREEMRLVAIDSYVRADAQTIAIEIALDDSTGDADQHELRAALAGFRADHVRNVLERLLDAQKALVAARQQAEAAVADAEARRAEVQAQADAVRAARAQQAGYAARVERRLDDKLAEAAALRKIDRTLADKITKDEQALAVKLSPPKSGSGTTTRPPAPAVDVPAPPPPARVDLVTTHGITVARSIAPALGSMLDAATADGIRFTGSGYRDYNAQVALRRQNCGQTNYDIYERPASECSPPTARPGQSNHERGLAVDFAANGQLLTSHDDAGWIWLAAHASTYGFRNLESEPWHWSVDGV
jgi:hypothetical protein